jgi:hypothetical protein
MITGKIRVWPAGANYSNQFTQIHLKINEELVLFNGYMDEVAVSNLNILLASHWDGVQLVEMKAKDPRKMAQAELTAWAKVKKHIAYTNSVIFLTQTKLLMLEEKKNKKSSSLSTKELDTEI